MGRKLFFSLFRLLAFQCEPEWVHEKTLQLFHDYPRLCQLLAPGIRFQEKFQVHSQHLHWNFPVGLAAGFDKNGIALNYLSRLGFGAIEVGTVTPNPQDGNPKPRLFRYPQEQSLRNFMGIPNHGQEALRKQLQNRNRLTPLGINLGKNTNTSEAERNRDYLQLYQVFAPIADYLVINISCPNVPGGQKLQTSKMLIETLDFLQEARLKEPVPLFIKIAPTLFPEELKTMVEVASAYGLAGFIATNTLPRPEVGPGGFSGKILYEKATAVRNELLNLVAERPELDVIGVGGFSSFEQILDFWRRGGKFVQIYTAFIYQGPWILWHLQKKMEHFLQQSQWNTLQEFFEGNKPLR